MARHGVYVSEQATSARTPIMAQSGIPFVIGAAPIQSAGNPAAVGLPVLCSSWQDAQAKFGYSDNWVKYNLCEFMYSHFRLYGTQPVIFCNLLNPATMKSTVSGTDMDVEDHKVKLPIEAIDDATLVVKGEGGTGTAYIKGVDYTTYYDDEYLIAEQLSAGNMYSETSLNIAYTKVTPESINDSVVASGFENIEKCMSAVGIVPDILCAPGFSSVPTVAAAMALKAAGINGMFKAKALIDISTKDSGGATTYDAAAILKTTNNFTDENEIVCWPQLKLGDKTFNMSTLLAGLMAQVDTANGGCPYESPSNKAFKCDAMTLDNGKEVIMTLAEANTLNAAGILTALNFLGEWTAWGNYTACYPANTDVKDYFVPVSRMFDWIGNTLIRTFWSKLDRPMNRRLIDSIMDAANIWLNGLVGSGYLLGGRAEFVDAENPIENLMAGIVKIHIFMTPPSPAQEIDFVLEYDAEYVGTALQV